MIGRLLLWVIRKLGPRAAFSLTLLMAALGSVAYGLADVVRGLDVLLLLTVAALGMLTGWALAASQSPDWAAGTLAVVSGVLIVFLRIGRLGGELAIVLWALLVLYWEMGCWLLDGPPPDWLPLLQALGELGVRAGVLMSRWGDWALAWAAGDPAFDPVATALTWGGAMWMVAVWAGWKVRRCRPLLALIPAGVLLAATLYYAGASSFFLLPLLGVILLLMPFVWHVARERRWEATGIDFPDLGVDIGLRAALLSLALVAAAALAPSVSVRRIVQAVRDLGDERRGEVEVFAESLGVEQRPDPAQESVFDAARSGGLPRRHLLGSGPELSERVVMVVSTGDLPPAISGIGEGRRPPRYYWRSITYDRYWSRGWRAGETETAEYDAGEPVITATLPTQRVVRQEVQVIGDLGGLLHVAGVLVATDHGYSVAWRPPHDAFGAEIESPTYRADSLLPVVSEAQLRDAGSDYPDWVRARYLALPETVPARVLSLARDLTATEPTPYDRALAIESYLREFPYTLDVPAPSPDRDVVDYFLFDLQQGYCDYYATAMVVLARAVGLPARLVVGYASGTYDRASARYVVTEADAHAWVEVYFPGYEWVEFEPTAGLPAIERPAEHLAFEWSEPERALEPAGAGWSGGGGLWWWLLGALVLMALVGAVWSAADTWRLRRMEPAATVMALYGRLRRHGRRVDAQMRTGDTPYEFAAALAGWAARAAQGFRWGKALAPAGREARRLVELYVQASYSPRSPGAAEQLQAIKTWRRLRRRLWAGRIWDFWILRFKTHHSRNHQIVSPISLKPGGKLSF